MTHSTSELAPSDDLNLASIDHGLEADPYSRLRDRIQITGLRFYGYTGYLPEEQVLGQWFEVDFELWADLQPAARSGQLKDTFDYSQVVPAIGDLVRNSRFPLIETLVEEIATVILEMTGASRTKVRLTKCHPPVPELTGKVTLEIVRP